MDGFLTAGDNLPTLNFVKAGSAIPVIFSLAGNKGLNIFAADYPQPTKIASDTSAQQDEIEQTVTTGASSLTFGPLTNQYKYIWKIDKSWTGTCHQLIVKLVDGTIYLANF